MKAYQTKLWVVIAFLGACAVALAQVKQQQTAKSFLSIKKLMSHDEFTKSGLTKLNDEEITALDEWLQKYTVGVARAVSVNPSVAIGGDVIETHIDGDFKGWEGETVWKMDNGQIWQQSSYSYHYHYAYHPKVLIYRVSGGWKMKVDGDSDEVSVKKIN